MKVLQGTGSKEAERSGSTEDRGRASPEPTISEHTVLGHPARLGASALSGSGPGLQFIVQHTSTGGYN